MQRPVQVCFDFSVAEFKKSQQPDLIYVTAVTVPGIAVRHTRS